MQISICLHSIPTSLDNFKTQLSYRPKADKDKADPSNMTVVLPEIEFNSLYVHFLSAEIVNHHLEILSQSTE